MAHSFSTTVTQESKSLPGVTLIVRRLSSVLRAQRDIEIIEQTVRLAEINERMRDLQEPWQKFNDDGKPIEGSGPPMPLFVRVDIEKLDREAWSIINAYTKPATIRAGFVAAKGLDYDGAEATADLLLDNGPDSLIDEVWTLIQSHALLSAEEKKTSPSYGTSSELAADQTSSSIVTGANEPENTHAATATAIFPRT